MDELLNKLEEHGYIHIPYTTKSFKTDNLREWFGDTLFFTLIKENPKSTRLLASNKYVDLHTDHIKAKFIAWQCNSQSVTGGESVLLDLWPVLSEADEETLNHLQTIKIKSHCIFHDDLPYYPLFNVATKIFYYASFLSTEPDSQKAVKALAWFEEKIASTKKIEIKLSEGDWLIIDNHRMLHGRKEFPHNSNRILTRYWLKGTK